MKAKLDKCSFSAGESNIKYFTHGVFACPHRTIPVLDNIPPQLLPLILMFVMFGPVVLTGLIYVFEIVANSEFAVKIGLSDDPRTRLTKFYTKYNPTKMRDVS